jgi:hypothetical protein
MTLDSLEGIDPLYVIVGAALAYGVLVFLRREAGWLALGAVALICLSFLLLPAGQGVLRQAQALPNPWDKAQCLGQSALSGRPWGLSSEEAQGCRFRGLGVGSIGQGVAPGAIPAGALAAKAD